MNKLQRAVLIGVGLLIAIIQLVGIADDGLDENRGWAVSFLISAVLLFVGLGSWPNLGAWLPFKARAKTTPVPALQVPPPQSTQSEKYKYGIHISELDIAIRAHENYAKQQKLYDSLRGNGKSLKWNCCASVYASMRYAARKSSLKVHNMVWNTIVRAIVVRMSTEELEGVGMGDPQYKGLEQAAYDDVEKLNRAVDAAIEHKGSFAIQPIVQTLSSMFGTSAEEPIKALSAIVMMNAETAHQKILPELMADLK